MPKPRVRGNRKNDKAFFLVMSIASALLIFAGFSRTYYLKSYFNPSTTLSVLVHIHALVFSLWMLYFVLQTALIAVDRPSLHRKHAVSGALIGTAMIALGLSVAVTAMRLHHGSSTQDAETIFLIGLFDIGSFALFFILGYLRRRDREAHQRLMLLAVIVGLTGAAIGRLNAWGLPIPAQALVNLAFIFAGPIYDLITLRRIHRVYIFGCLFALVTLAPIRLAIGATPQWHRIADMIAGQ